MKRTYRFGLYPKKEQISKLGQNLTLCRRLYNNALEQRKTSWDSKVSACHTTGNPGD